MKTSNVQTSHPFAIIAGWLDDELPPLETGDSSGDTPGGGTPGTGGVGTSSSPVAMLNNAGQDLLIGDVVVADETADNAVTVTTTAGDTRIAGVVQEPIADGQIGPVLFNGYAAIVNAPGAARGEYLKTSTTAAQATSTTDREAGSFAVALTGTDLPDIASDAVMTTAATPVEMLSITMPTTLPVDRVLFLALWLVDDVTDVAIAGWTLIGSEDGFNYYTRVSTGFDVATATWTGPSTAVASVLLLHPSVSLPVPVEDHDYEDTTSAAALSGLSDAPHYAIAGVRADVASPGSGFTLLAGGSAEFEAAGTPSLVQSKLGTTSVTFDATLTASNLMVAIPFHGVASGHGSSIHSTDPRQGGTCPIDANMTKFGQADTNLFGSSGINGTALLGKIIDAGDTYSGPFGNNAACDGASSTMVLLEFDNVGLADYEVASVEGMDSSPIDLGTFTVGANDLLIMAAVLKQDGYSGSPDPTIGVNGFTQVLDTNAITNGWCWVGYKVGDGDASITKSNLGGGWAAFAVLLKGGTQSVAGTLAGKYIGHDSAVTSPFSGAGKEDDAIFAVNLLTDAIPSALLYGPDLGGAEGTSVAAADVPLADAGGFFTATDVEAALAELAAKDIGYQAHGAMGSTETFSALTGWHSGTFDDDCTFTFSGATSGLVASMVLELLEDGTGGWQPTWPGSVVWPGGSAPTHDDTAGSTTLYLFQSRDGGTTWFGFQAGGGGSSVGALDDLSDVTITTPAEDDTLRYISGDWVNDNRRWEPVTFDPGSGPEVVFTATDIVMTWETY